MDRITPFRAVIFALIATILSPLTTFWDFLDNHTRIVISGIIIAISWIVALICVVLSVPKLKKTKESKYIMLVGLVVILIPIVAYLILAILAGLSLQE